MTYWLFTSVVRPILTYAAAVWWTSMRFGSYVGLLQKVQRLCCLGISGAKRNASTRAIETILAIRPIAIQVKYEAASAMIRLRAAGEWANNGHITGHRTMLDQLPGYYVTDWDCDRISERSVTTLCDTLIPERESWLNGNFLGDRPGIHFCADLDVRKCFRLPDHNTVLSWD